MHQQWEFVEFFDDGTEFVRAVGDYQYCFYLLVEFRSAGFRGTVRLHRGE